MAFDGLRGVGRRTVDAASSGGQFEELVDELNLTPNISSAHPPNLPLPQHVHRLITLNGLLRRLEFSEPLLGVHPAFDRSVVLLESVVQVLYGSVPATAAKCPFLLYVGDGRAVDRCQVRMMTRGCGWDGWLSAFRNRRLAASASRNDDSRKSIVAPAESMARYR